MLPQTIKIQRLSRSKLFLEKLKEITPSAILRTDKKLFIEIDAVEKNTLNKRIDYHGQIPAFVRVWVCINNT